MAVHVSNIMAVHVSNIKSGGRGKGKYRGRLRYRPNPCARRERARTGLLAIQQYAVRARDHHPRRCSRGPYIDDFVAGRIGLQSKSFGPDHQFRLAARAGVVRKAGQGPGAEGRRDGLCTDFAPETLAVPEHPRNARGFRTVIKTLRRTGLNKSSAFQHHQVICQVQGFVRIVRDQQGDGAGILQHSSRVFAQGPAQLNIDVGERLVEQQDARRRRERPGKGNALLLAARKRVWIAFAKARQADLVEQLGDAPLLRTRLAAEPEADVFRHRQVREQGAFLKYEADGPFFRRRCLTRTGEQDAVQNQLAVLYRQQARGNA